MKMQMCHLPVLGCVLLLTACRSLAGYSSPADTGQDVNQDAGGEWTDGRSREGSPREGGAIDTDRERDMHDGPGQDIVSPEPNGCLPRFGSSNPTGRCNPAGWCWENPLPHGNDLHGVWGPDKSNVWAVGKAGTVVGPRPWATASDLHDVHGVGETVFAVDGEGTLWKVIPDAAPIPKKTVSGQRLRALWVVDPTHVWVTGDDVVGYYDGKELKETRALGTWYAVWANAEGAMTVGRDRNESMASWWTDLDTQQSFAGKLLDSVGLFDVRGDGKDNILAVGSRDSKLEPEGLPGTVLHFDGTRWQTSTVTDKVLNALWQTPQGSIYRVGSRGMAQQVKATGELMDLDCQRTNSWLYDVWADDSGAWTLVGPNGTFWQQDPARNISRRYPIYGGGESTALSAISCAQNQALAVGDDQLQTSSVKGSWSAGAVTGRFIDVAMDPQRGSTVAWAITKTEVFELGGGQPAPTSVYRVADSRLESLHAICATGSSRAMALGHDAQDWFLLTSEDQWTQKIRIDPYDDNPGLQLRDLACTDTHFVAVGLDGAHLVATLPAAGGSVHPTTSNTGKQWLGAVWMLDDKNYVAVGSRGTVVRVDDGVAKPEQAGTTDLNAVWATSERGAISQIYAVGDSGSVQHFGGQSWQPVHIGTHQHLYGICAVDAGQTHELVVVGENATIIRKQIP